MADLFPEITTIGFPKCGTSALMRQFTKDPMIRVLTAPNGSLEVSWPLIREIRSEPEPGRILAHKFTAYAYNRKALDYLAGVNPGGLLVLCVRDPARALVSWHNMHRSIARSGKNPEHFAWQERDFYAECSLPDYFARFARRRLQYDRHLGTLLEIVPTERLAVVSQERMAQDIASVAGYLKALARGEPVATPAAPAPVAASRHEGYADKAATELDETISEGLRGVQRRLMALIADDVMHKCI